MSCTGTGPMPAIGTPCRRMARASSTPNKRHAHMAGTGRHLAKIKAASAMRRLPAGAEPGGAELGGEPEGDEVDGNARDDLIAAMGDRGKAVDEREADRCCDCPHES